MGTFVDKAVNISYQGEWKDNKKNGDGILTMKDGSLFKGRWRNGEMIVRARQEMPTQKTSNKDNESDFKVPSIVNN